MQSLRKVIDIRGKEVQEVYKSFIDSHARNSERTADEYDKRIREFFMMTAYKAVEFLTVEDIKSVKNKDVENKYVKILLEKGNSANTILTKLRSVRSFYNRLLANEIEVNPLALSVKMKTEVKHHEALTMDEYLGLLEFMKYEDDGLEKYLLTKTLFHTANRKTATINMKWDESFIRNKDAVSGELVWVIKVKDKGSKWIEKPISDEFYNELTEIKTNEYVFPIMSRSGAYKRYERSLKKYGEKIGKSLSFHCLKATSITLGYAISKDINLVKQLGGHASIATTEIYIKEEKSYINQLSYSSSKDINDSVLNDLSHDELLKFINDNRDIKMQIVTRLSRNIKQNH